MNEWLLRAEVSGLRSFSDSVARHFNWTTSNQITFARLVLTIPMTLAFWQTMWVTGTILYVIIAIMDFLDGAVARYQQAAFQTAELSPETERRWTFLQRLSYRGVTSLGKELDPLADKATYFGALLPTAIDVAYPFLLWGSLTLAVLLTVARPIKRRLGVGDGAANWFGKRKMWVEIVVIVVAVLLPYGDARAFAVNLLLGIAFLFAVLSLAGQIYSAFTRPSAS